VLLTVLAVYLTFTGSDAVEADNGHYDATHTQTLSSVVPGADRGATTTLTTASPDLNFSNNITFDPVGVVHKKSCSENIAGTWIRDNSPVDGIDNNGNTVIDEPGEGANAVDPGESDCIQPGLLTGNQVSQVILGLAGDTCNSPLTVKHSLYSIAMPNNEADPRLSSNIAFPQLEGTSRRFARWRIGGVPTGALGSPQTPGVEEEVALDGVVGIADNLPFDNYPSYILDAFDPDKTPTSDGPLDPVLPVALYGGITQVVGTEVPLYYAQFENGQLNTAFVGDPPNPLGRAISTPLASATGDPNQALLNDPTAVLANPSTITDFCTGLVAENQSSPVAAPAEIAGACTESLDSDGDTLVNDGCPAIGPAETGAQCLNSTNDDGDGAGNTNDGCPPAGPGLISRATNPATPGTHVTLNYTSSLRDAENDGFENTFDSCPKNANVEDGRTTNGPDLDNFNNPSGDMLDSSCDPTPSGTGSATGFRDHDGDTFNNSQDNCPTVGSIAYAPGVTLTGAETAGDTTWNYTSAGDPIAVNDSLLMPDGGDPDSVGEIVKVVTVNTGTNDITVVRAAYNTLAEAQTGGSVILHSQSDNKDSEVGLDYSTSTMDGGPQGDGIGDLCDTGSIIVTVNGQSVTVNFASGVSNGHWHARGNVIPICYSTGVVDADGDGYCATGTVGCAGACLTDSTATDSGACAGTVPPSCAQRHSAWGSGVLAHLGSFDTDRGGGDTVGAGDPGGVTTQIACPTGAADLCPEVGFDSDWIESYVGTNPAQACSTNTGANNEPFDSWAFDLNDSQNVNLSDISILGGTPYNKFVNQVGGGVRFDMNADGTTNLADVSILGGAPYNKTCRRDDGTFGQPQ